MEVASSTTRTREASGRSGTKSRSTSRIATEPRTVVTIMCFALKVTAEWAGSMIQVIAVIGSKFAGTFGK